MVRRTRRGFTLLELLLVIGILVILAGAAVPYFITRGEKAKVDLAKAAVAQNGNIASALDMFKHDIGRYPTTEEGLGALITRPEGDDPRLENWVQYMKAGTEFKDPWGVDYQYTSPGQHNTDGYDLSSAGPNGQHGDEDDIANWVKEGGGSP